MLLAIAQYLGGFPFDPNTAKVLQTVLGTAAAIGIAARGYLERQADQARDRHALMQGLDLTQAQQYLAMRDSVCFRSVFERSIAWHCAQCECALITPHRLAFGVEAVCGFCYMLPYQGPPYSSVAQW